jgi:hypothetical protein
MRGAIFWLAGAVLLLAPVEAGAKPEGHDTDAVLSGPSFPVGNLTFTIPSRWEIQMVESPARGGQWRVPPLHAGGEGGQVVAFFFGRGVGGSWKENIEAWIGTISNADGHPAANEVKHRDVGGFKITQVVIFGTYNEVISLPGIPPRAKPNYGLLGTVIENPAGNIYWRFTGPEALVTATLPLFNKMIDSVKVAGTR